MGDKAPSFEGLDVNGDALDMASVCGMGKPAMFVMSGGWCPPCNELAAGMAGQAHGFGPDLDTVREAVNNDEMEFIEIMLDPAADYGPVDAAYLQTWKSMYPNDQITLIGDPTTGTNAQEPLWLLLGEYHAGGLPFGAVIDENYNWQVFGTTESFAAAAAL